MLEVRRIPNFRTDFRTGTMESGIPCLVCLGPQISTECPVCRDQVGPWLTEVPGVHLILKHWYSAEG